MRGLLHRIRPLHVSFVIGALVAAYTFANYHSTWFVGSLLEKAELKVLDSKFVARGRVELEPDVVIAAGDERTIDVLGLWGTWDRAAMARIIDVLIEAQADVVAFDMVFSDQAGIDARHAARLRTLLQTTDDQVNALSEGLQRHALERLLRTALAGDVRLAQSFEDHSSRVVQGMIVNPVPEPGKAAANPAPVLERLDVFAMREYGFGVRYVDQGDSATQAGAEQVVATLAAAPEGRPSDLYLVREAKGEALLPRPEFLGAAEYVGFFSVDPDSDGTMRRIPLVYRYGDAFLPSLALATASLRFGASPMLIAHDKVSGALSHIVFALEGGGVRMVPVDHDGSLLVNYYGPSEERVEGVGDDERGIFARVSLADVYCYRNTECPTELRTRFDPERLRAKVVLVAVTAIGTYDQRVTPFSPVVPGVEVHAAAVQNLLRADPLSRDDINYQAEMILALVLSVVLGEALSVLSVAWGTLLTLALAALWVLVDVFVLFGFGHMWVHQVPILLQLIVTWSAVNALGYLTEGREKARLKKEFSTVLAPTVVDELLKNPDLAGLGGAERDLTVMFSDIRGFTTISEKLTPEGLTSFLNEYLTPMTEVLLKHQGTLDKYMGDAIMAFWGAPIAQKDHAARACHAALDMMEDLALLRQRWRAEGKPDIDIGIGLNSGLMRVGFMGSERMRNYTLLGDNVNLGSRLEGVNKEYGTHIIISQYTVAAAGDAIHARELDAIRVKGKKEPVIIYELRGRGPAAGPEAAFLARFHDALAAYKERQFHAALAGFQAIASERPDDEPTQVYIERCIAFLSAPPPRDWDGVYVMKTK